MKAGHRSAPIAGRDIVNISLRQLGDTRSSNLCAPTSCGPMSASPGILLISDRPQWGKELAAGLQTVAGCRMIEPGDRQTAAPPSAVVVLDVDLRRSSEVENLRSLLTAPRRAAIPIVALLRNESHVERVQAAALG